MLSSAYWLSILLNRFISVHPLPSKYRFSQAITRYNWRRNSLIKPIKSLLTCPVCHLQNHLDDQARPFCRWCKALCTECPRNKFSMHDWRNTYFNQRKRVAADTELCSFFLLRGIIVVACCQFSLFANLLLFVESLRVTSDMERQASIIEGKYTKRLAKLFWGWRSFPIYARTSQR